MAINVSNKAGSQFEKVKIPARVYKAELESMRVVQMDDFDNPGQKIDKIAWGFAILGGKTKPVIEMLTNLKASLGNEKSANRKYYMALTGSEPPADGESDLEELIGLGCNVRVQDHTNKKGEVYSIIADLWALETAEPGESF